MGRKLLLGLFVTLAFFAQRVDGSEDFVALDYDRAFMDALTEDSVWQRNEETHLKQGARGSPAHVKHIDGEFFDNFIVSRWTSQWLAGDTTWVIAVGRPIPWSQGYKFSLAVRSVNILCYNFYQARPDVRFGVVDDTQWEDIKITLNLLAPGYVVLKDGKILHNEFSTDSYTQIYEFLERKIPVGEIYKI